MFIKLENILVNTAYIQDIILVSSYFGDNKEDAYKYIKVCYKNDERDFYFDDKSIDEIEGIFEELYCMLNEKNRNKLKGDTI